MNSSVDGRPERPMVLVIDDSEIALSLIVDVLEQHKITAIGLPGPIGATATVIRNNIKVVVTDVNMPELSGNSLVSLFRDNPRTKDVKVVLVSDLPADQLYELAQHARASGVVTKSRLEAELPAIVKRLLGQKHTASS